MTRFTLLSRVTVFGALGALVLALPAARGEEHENENQEKKTRQLQIIELEHRDPQQLMQVLALSDDVAHQGHQAYYRAPAAGVAGQPQADQQQQQKERATVAANSEKNVLFVRGDSEQIERIERLVKALDVKNEDLQPQDVAGHRIIPLSSEQAGKVQSTLTQLGLAGRMIAMGDVQLITYSGEEKDEKYEQAERVINKLTDREKKEEAEEKKDGEERDDADDGEETDV